MTRSDSSSRLGSTLKAGGVYVAGAWLAYEIVAELVVMIGLPDAVAPAALLLLIAGVPMVLATAWVQSAPETARSEDARVLDPTLHPELGDVAPERSRVSTRLAGLLTWRRTAAGGVAVFVLLGLATTGFMTARQAGIGPFATVFAQGVLGQDDPILIADFDSERDPALGQAIVEALRIDLLQSDVIRIVEPAFVRDALLRMERDPAAGVPVEVAAEMVEREGLRAYIRGGITQSIAGFQISAELVSADGTVLVPAREVARDSTELIEAVDRLSNRLRERIGESLRSIQRSQSLPQVTTRSLPALRRYADGLRISRLTGDPLTALEQYEQAITLDSMFASAHLAKGIQLSNVGLRPAERNAALRRAYALRDRLSEREKWLATAAHAAYVTGDNHASIDAYARLLALDPEDNTARNNMAYRLGTERRFAEAERAVLDGGEKALKESAYLYLNLAAAQYAQGKVEDVRRTAAAVQRDHPKHINALNVRVNFALAEGELERADSLLTSFEAPGSPTLLLRSLQLRAAVAGQQGRLARATALMEEAMAASARAGVPEIKLFAGVAMHTGGLLMEGHAGDRVAAVRRLLAEIGADRLPPGSRNYPNLAYFYALAEEPVLARAALADYERFVPPDDRAEDAVFVEGVRATVDLYDGRGATAVPALRGVVEKSECLVCFLPELARAYELTGQPDSARAVYERYLGTTDLFRGELDAFWKPVVLLRVAELHEAAGDRERARERYAQFVELWKDADASLQPRVRAVRQRLAADG